MSPRTRIALLLIPLLTACHFAPGSGKISPAQWLAERDAERLERAARYREALAIHERLLAKAIRERGPESLVVAGTQYRIAKLKHQLGDLAAAESLLRQSLRIEEKWLGHEHTKVATTLHELGSAMHARGKLQDAEDLLRESLRIDEKLLGHEHTKVATTLHALGGVMHARGKLQDAEDLFRESLRIKEKLLGHEHTNVAATLHALGGVLQAAGKLQDAEDLFRESLRIKEKLLGHEHTDVAATLHALGRVLHARGKLQDAEDLFRESLRITEKLLGHEHTNVAVTLHNLGGVLQAAGKLQDAEDLFRESLRITENLLGHEHTKVATTLHELGGVMHAREKLQDAEDLFRESLRITEKLLGHEHTNVAATLHALGGVLHARGKLQDAEDLFRESLRITEKLLGHEHTNVAATLHTLGGVLQAAGKLQDAEDLFRESLRIDEKLLGHEHTKVAATLHTLGGVLHARGKLQDAEDLFRESLRIDEKLLGHEHTKVATTLHALGGVMHARGKLQDAEDLFRESLRIKEKLLGHEHTNVAATLHTLGGVRQARGKLQDAEDLFRESLRIKEKLLGHEHTNVAATLHELGRVRQARGKLQDAEDLFRESLRITEKLLGHEHTNVAVTLHELGGVRQARDAFQDAEALFRESLRIREKLLGPEHRELAHPLHQLALLRQEQDDLVEAEALWQRAIGILQRAEAPPLAGAAQAGYAALLVEQGCYAEAEPYFKDALAAARAVPAHDSRTVRGRLLALGRFYFDMGRYAEAQKYYLDAALLFDNEGESIPTDVLGQLADLFIAQNKKQDALHWARRALQADLHELSEGLLTLDAKEFDKRVADQARRADFVFSLFAKQRMSAEQAEFALSVSMARRYSLVAVQLVQSRALWPTLPADVQADWQRLQALGAQEATLKVRQLTHDRFSSQLLEARLAAIETERKTLRKRIAEKIPPGLNAWDRLVNASAADVAKRLDEHSAYLEIVEYDAPAPAQKSAKQGRSSPNSQNGYLAFLLFSDGKIVYRDLGSSDQIDSLLRDFAKKVFQENRVSAINRLAARVYSQTLGKLALDRPGITTLYVAADGQFAVAPLAAMIDEKGRWLIDRYHLVYVNSGRDLLAPAPQEEGAQGIFAWVNPRYDLAPKPPREPASAVRSIPFPRLTRGLAFAPLPNTAREGQAIKRYFEGLATVFEGRAATESALRSLQRPLLLHIGSHASFLESTFAARDGQRSARGALQPKPTPSDGMQFVALAGAMHYPKEQAKHPDSIAAEDGLILPAELAIQDLRGTQLVVFSACQTGLGKLRRGQGVLGLRSAAFVAGAETVVTSLWNVNDAVTAELMEAFYGHLKQGQGRITALRQAALEIKRRHPDPYYWAAFVGHGLDVPLRLSR